MVFVDNCHISLARRKKILLLTMSGTAHEAEEAGNTVRRLCPLVSEAHALCYALAMALSSTPREEFTVDEIDALCQVAYELLNKLGKAVDCCAGSGEPPGC